MSGKTIDFFGIQSFDYPLLRGFEAYLYERESKLFSRLLQSLSENESLPSLEPGSINYTKLSDVVDSLSKKIREITEKRAAYPPLSEREKTIEEINAASWEYVEILEVSAIELFNRVETAGIEKWLGNLFGVLESVKDLLLHQIDDVVWMIRRLKVPLRGYRWLCLSDSSWWNQIKNGYLFHKSPLDPKLLINLASTEKFIKARYQSFAVRYNAFTKLSQLSENSLSKITQFSESILLDKEDLQRYQELSRWLKLWELDAHHEGVLRGEIVRTLKNISSIDQSLHVFHRYYKKMLEVLFKESLELKKMPLEMFEGFELKRKFFDKNTALVVELQDLMHVIVLYRQFLLKTDPNPYVRSRWGFSECIVGPEPVKSKELSKIVFDCNRLLGWYERLLRAVGGVEARNVSSLHAIIEQLLHDMSSPLISQSVTRSKGNELLHCLDQCDILGSTHYETISYVGLALNKAMRLDWKYHALNEIPLFHELYLQAQGFWFKKEDPQHLNRLEKFQKKIRHIENWVSSRQVDSHVHEIEVEINDMKMYLQDFLAAIQRFFKDHSLEQGHGANEIDQFQHQLLIYRYVFGNFFLFLLQQESKGGNQLRVRFLFVDQYFETIQSMLQ